MWRVAGCPGAPAGVQSAPNVILMLIAGGVCVHDLSAISSDLGAISAPPLELGDELGQVGAELGEVALGGLARD